MTHTSYKYGMIGAIFIAALVCLMAIAFRPAFASAPSGLPANLTSAASLTVSTTALQLAATSTTCSARIVSTGNSAVMLGFSAYAGTTTTGSVGVWQGASTTVAYDSGLYGCGQLSAYSYTSSLVDVIVTN